MVKAILIDDEKNSRDVLRQLISRYCPQIQVIAEADGYHSARLVLEQSRPDVIFLDVQMPDGSGFQLLESLNNIDFEIVFTTAFDQYAIQAIKYSALDYLLKPIDLEELRLTVDKIIKVRQFPSVNKKVEVLLQSLKFPEKFPNRVILHTSDTIHVVDSESIIHCESDDYYTRFYFNDKSTLLVSKTLKEVEELLNPHSFVRVHKSHLVNIQYIRGYNRIEGGVLLLSDGSRISVSRRKREHIMELLERFGIQI
jgi:two-component system LytT family response regulator